MSLGAKGKCHIELEITSADILFFLNQVNKVGIKIYYITYINDLSIRVKVSKKDYPRIAEISQKTGSSIKYIGVFGFHHFIERLLGRPILLAFLIIGIFFCLLVPSKILFVTVSGNERVPTNKIIEAAEVSGIRFGVSRRSVRSEKIKNQLLASIPELQWVGINTSGCTAVISVKEQTPKEIYNTINSPVSSIVASMDGIIQKYTVISGNPLLKIGQAVTKGQVLVSGYLDCGIVTKTMQSNAEIYALTFRDIVVALPESADIRGDLYKKHVRYSIRIGKNIIKLHKDSRILDVTCGKIYEEKFLEFPGGYQLPFSILKETTLYYLPDWNVASNVDNMAWMENYAIRYVEDQMVSGQIISSQTCYVENGDAVFFRGRFACSEMIAQVKSEDVTQKDEQNDR